MHRSIKGVLLAALALNLAACLDLEVVNENNPDRRRALSNPADVEGILGTSSFRAWYNTLHGLANITIPFGTISDENTSTNPVLSVQWSQEPRQVFRNDDLAQEIWIPRAIYDNMSECIAATNDGLEQIKDGMRIETFANPADTAVSDNTTRAKAWGKMWQGICAGYLALGLDRFAMRTEDEQLPLGWEALSAWEKERLTASNWSANMDIAIRSLEQAIQIADTARPFQTLDAWIPGQRYTNVQVSQLAHTMIARLLVYSARYPEDRAAVNWDKVLQHTERGLTYDFGPVLLNGVITDGSYLNRLTNTSTNAGAQFRADYRLIGPADQSGNYQAWLAKVPHSEATQFPITTPDRRITGNTPTSNGGYFRYTTGNSGFDQSRGLQHFSLYQWHRRANYGGFNSQTGHYALASQDENRLLRAEALLRRGRTQEAVDLLNVTRTRQQTVGTTVFATNLPPLTLAGVPTVSGACVPRKNDGTCGDLMDALKWERAIELMGQDPMRAFLDRRGFGQLQPGTFVMLPVPARYLVTLGLPLYTFGGVGGEGGAR